MFQFAQNVQQRRKAHGLTQQQLAQFVGVSKAAVSKWETGTSYPDISILPKLATCLHVTIDDLLGYAPQMTDAQVRQTYRQLMQRLESEPYDDVYAHIEQLVIDYYTCFPLLTELCVLLVNYITFATDKQRVLDYVQSLCQHIQQKSDDFIRIEQARVLEAAIYMERQQPDDVLRLLGDDITMRYGVEGLIVTAHVQKGEATRAEQLLQVAVYQQLAELMGYTTQLLTLHVQRPQFKETVQRGEALLQLFKMKQINVHHALLFHLTAAQCYMQRGEPEQALQQLKRYVACCNALQFPLMLRGDEYFDKVESWMDEHLVLGRKAPRDERTIQQDLYAQLAHHPAFEPLQPTLAFRQLLHQLQPFNDKGE